jgi:hypothetical protein
VPDLFDAKKIKIDDAEFTGSRVEEGESMFGCTLRHVYLSEEDYATAVEGGQRRYDDAEAKNMQDYLGAKSPRHHIVGAVGEVAVRILLGEPVVVNSLEGNVPDIPPDIQVRCTRDFLTKAKKSDKKNWLIVGCRWWLQRREQRQCVTIYGALRVRNAQKIPLSDPGRRGRKAHFIHWSDFKDISPLIIRHKK